MFNILHIDSSNFFLKIFGELFREKGFIYFPAKDSETAFNHLEKNDINLILTAIELSDNKGDEFIKKLLHSSYKHIPVFVITGNESLEYRKQVFELGIVDYIIKTTPIPEIVEFVSNYLRKENFLKELKNSTIAILDDSEFELKIAENIFNSHDIKQVSYFKSETDFFNTDCEFDIYLIDMVLEHSSGEEVILKLRKRLPYNPIIAISGVSSNKTIFNVLLTGANDYILKPYNQDILLAKLETNLKNYRILKDLKEKNYLLEKAAILDVNLNIYNQEYMKERLIYEFKRSKRYVREMISLVITFNQVINLNPEIIKIISLSLREVDILGIFDEKKLIIILPETIKENASSLIERLKFKIDDFVSKKNISLKASFDFKDFNTVKSIIDFFYKGTTLV